MYEYYSANKKRIPVICNTMGESGGDCAKWNMPDRERQVLYGITYSYMRNLKKQLIS